MIIIFGIGVAIIILGLILLFLMSIEKKKFGVLATNKRIYQDTIKIPGETLYSHTLPLAGKPDYLIKNGEDIIPVEKKKANAPRSQQYMNNVMQLMAYCFLVEENFGIRPPGGYIEYADRELKIQYTKEAEESVRKIVQEILENKKMNKEFLCFHPDHNNV